MDDETTGPQPAGHNTVNGFIFVEGAARFIDFLGAVFDAVEEPEAHAPDFFAADGTLIHAEVRIGNSTIMLADRKADWPFTPSMTQVYVDDAEETLRRAAAHGAEVVTPVSAFFGGYDIARFLDPWHNVWWLFAPAVDVEASTQEWEESDAVFEPGPVYTTILETMRTLVPPERSVSTHDIGQQR